MSTPSYSVCAVRMVRSVVMPSLRTASCCSVLVVKGAAARRVFALFSTLMTFASWPCSAATTAAWLASSVKLNCSTLAPCHLVSFAENA